MENFMVYLAGKCKGLTDEEQNNWRNYAKKRMDDLNDVQSNYRVIAINPNDYFSYSTQRHKTNKQIKEYYMSLIDKSSVVLVNLNDSDSSVGTGQELQRAVDKGVPVIGFGINNMYSWEVESDCQVVFDTVWEAIDYIANYYVCLR